MIYLIALAAVIGFFIGWYAAKDGPLHKHHEPETPLFLSGGGYDNCREN